MYQQQPPQAAWVNQPGYGMQQPQYIDPADNVRVWLIQNVNNQIVALANEHILSQRDAQLIINEFRNNIPFFMNILASETNNYTINFTDQNYLTAFIGRVIQQIKMNIDARRNQMAINQMSMGNQMSMPMRSIQSISMQPQLQPQQLQPQVMNQPNFGARTRTTQITPAQQEQIQQYADAIAQPIQETVPNDPIVSRYIKPSVNVLQSKTVSEEVIDVSEDIDNADMPLVLSRDMRTQFDETDKYTWPIALINKQFEIGRMDIPDATKKYLSTLSIEEEYWRSKGVEWVLENGLHVSMQSDDKQEARKYLPAISTQTSKKDSYTAVLPQGHILSKCDTDDITLIAVFQDNTLRRNIYHIHLTYDNVIAHELDFLEDCTNGGLAQLTLQSSGGNPTITPKEDGAGIAVSVDYAVLKVLRIPHKEMSEYFKSLDAILVDHDKSYTSRFGVMYTQITDLLGNMPKKYGDILEQFIVEMLNEAFSRTMRHIEAGVYSAPRISSWSNIHDLMVKDRHNRLKKAYNDYNAYLATVVYQTLYAILDGNLLDPSDPAQIEAALLHDAVADIVEEEYGSAFSTRDLTDVLNSDTPESKETLKKICDILESISVMSVAKTTCFTTVNMPYKHVKNHGGKMLLYPADNHMSDFEIVALSEFDYPNVFKDLIIIDRSKYTWIKGKPVPYFKLIYTLDKYIGCVFK